MLEHAIEEFKIYTDPYKELSDNCTLKIDHTFRVMKICEEIAQSLNLSSLDISIAMLCGLLHDIGRFEQWGRYKTFSDGISVDHGDLGVEILTTNNYIRQFIPNDKYDTEILTSIMFHNKYDYPDNLSDREKLFTKIIRDADKIDILYLYTVGHISLNTCNEEFSSKIMDCLASNKLIRRGDKSTKADSLAVSLGFIFDINYKRSIEILKEKNYLNQEIDIYKAKSNNNKFREQLEEIRNIINLYIEKRMSDNYE